MSQVATRSKMLAVDKLYERKPDAQHWVIRIGHRAVFRFGSRSLRKPYDVRLCQ